MRTVMLYRPGSESASQAQAYASEYNRLHPGHEIELLSTDSVSGSDMAKLYGITSYPAIIALGPDGSLLQLWQDEQLPLMSEVEFYAR